MEPDTTTPTTTPVVPVAYRQASAILAHADGVVVRVDVDGSDVDVLVTGPMKSQLLAALSHTLTDPEIKAFRDLLTRQGK